MVVWVLLEGESIKIELSKVGVDMFYRIEHAYRKHMFSRVGDQDSTENHFWVEQVISNVKLDSD